MSTPSVSIITIFLDAERFLEEAIESILAQTYDHWELVLVDDGSTDGSSALAQDYAARHPDRIRYCTHPGHENRGMSASRNRGIRASTAPLIAFLDADDIWLPRRLEAQVELIEALPTVDMVYGPTRYWYSWTGAPTDQDRDCTYPLGLPLRQPIEPPTVLRKFLETSGHILPGTCSLLVRRSAVEAVGGFEEKFRGSYEDQVFLAKITAHHRVAVTDECLDLYRQHPNSCCAIAMEEGEYIPDEPHPAKKRYLDWLRTYFDTCGLDDPSLRAALDSEFWPYRHPWQYHVYSTARELLRTGRERLRNAIPPESRLWIKRTLLPATDSK